MRAPTFPTDDTSLRVDCSKLGPHSQLAHVVAPRSRVDCAPAQLLGLPHLETLVLSGSRVRGSLPANLSTATRLKHLVVNGLGLYGTVSALPPTMVNLYLHDNRLSCRLPEADVPGLKQALVLVGNRFSTPLPAWMRGSYDFDWAAFTTATDSGLEDLALFDVGLPALLLLASVLVFCAPCGRTATPPGGCEQEAAAPYWRLQLSLIKVLGALAVVACAALLPIFVTHSGFRVCGQLETTASASLLSGAGWATAGFLCLYGTVLLVSALLVFHSSGQLDAGHEPAAQPEEDRRGGACGQALRYLVFALVLCCTAVPTFADVALQSAPPENTLSIPVGSSAFKFLFSSVSAPILMALANTLVLPRVAQWTSGSSGVATATILVFVALFTNTIIAPSLATLLFSEDCFQVAPAPACTDTPQHPPPPSRGNSPRLAPHPH